MTEVNRKTAQQVFRLLDEGASLARASADTGLSESTVSRLSRVRRWLDEGLPDEEITLRLAGSWSRERIAHLRDWHGGTDHRSQPQHDLNCAEAAPEWNR